MTRNGYGHVINIASGLAFQGSPGMPHYAASKSAVTNLTKTLATAVGEHGFTVNAVAPGFTESPSIIKKREAIAATNPRGAEFLSSSFHIPRRTLKRAQMPEDLVGTVLFLASPASDFLTGQTLVCDGGSVYH
jgi:NAD(P)-dependent dehydrogenase (short-subunit alcohol dehydrogenase family)